MAGDAFVAPTASILGDVRVGAGSSVWYGAKVRGDVAAIAIGANSSIGDCAMVHSAKIQSDNPTAIGDNVTVGPNAIVHACTIHSGAVIGAGARVLDGAVVHSGAVVAPGALVGPGKVVGAGELWAGVPAKLLRPVTAEEAATATAAVAEAAGLARLHATECGKGHAEVAADVDAAFDKATRHPDYFPKVDPEVADVPVIDGGTAPHPYEENNRTATKFNKSNAYPVA